jgi:bla regulator protein blaR1
MINAISHTLVHSLWQGALLSAITGLIMTCTRKSPSALRYNLLVSAMALFAVGVAGTFYFEFNAGGPLMPVFAGQRIINSSPFLHETKSPGASVTETIGSYLNRYGALIVWVWLLIVCARCVRLAAGLHMVNSLRHKDIFSIGSFWEERLRQLCGQMGIKRRTVLVESVRTLTPMVTGHLKPLILIPIGMFNGLSVEEAEAVLLHELAHIRRADYLVNLLQNLMEIVFFFNPAVLWLSALIKAERENCCDDMVLVRSSKLNYIKALVACQEFRQPSPAYAMALKGNNGGLKNRIARIIFNKNSSLNSRERSLLAVCLIATGIFAAAFTTGAAFTSGAKFVQHDTTKPASVNTPFESDSDRTTSIIRDMLEDGIITSTNGLSFKIGTDEFVVNYKKQPEAVYQKYRVRYVATQYSGSDDWIWYYYFDSQKWAFLVAHKTHPAAVHPPTNDTTTGVFRGKEN